jgi:hypothetical protein
VWQGLLGRSPDWESVHPGNGFPQRIGDHRGHADQQADPRPLGAGLAWARVAVPGEAGVGLSGRQIPEHVPGSGSSVLAEPPGGTRGKVT